MNLYRVWWDDEHGSTIVLAVDEEQAADLYACEDMDREPPSGIDEIADLTDLTPRCVLGVE